MRYGIMGATLLVAMSIATNESAGQVRGEDTISILLVEHLGGGAVAMVINEPKGSFSGIVLDEDNAQPEVLVAAMARYRRMLVTGEEGRVRIGAVRKMSLPAAERARSMEILTRIHYYD